MLLVGFTLPVSNGTVAKDVLDLVADLNLSPVADEHGGGTTTTDLIQESVDELLVRLHSVGINNKGLGAHKELGCRGSVVNSTGVGIDGVGGNGFVASGNVGCRERGLESLAQVRTSGHASKLGGAVKSSPNYIDGSKAKVGKVGSKVPRTWGDHPAKGLKHRGPRGDDLILPKLEVSEGDNAIPMIITADSATPHQSVVTALDVAGQLGFTQLSITTQLAKPSD